MNTVMRAVEFIPDDAGAPSPANPARIVVGEREIPRPGPGEVLIKVQAAGINNADVMQRAGNYPPPEGASDIPGLEVAGTIEEASNWEFGTPVCALLAGGGYADYVVVDERQVLPLPDVTMVQAAGMVEVAVTVYSNMCEVAGLREGETVLVHGGTGGIGQFALKLAQVRGARAIATAGTDAKCALVEDLGATAINYRTADFVSEVKKLGGADVILDTVGGPYLEDNIKALKPFGRLAIIGTAGGPVGEVNLGRVMAKRAAIYGTTLRTRPPEEKGAILRAVQREVWPVAAQLVPEIETFDITEVEDAYTRFAEPERTGKLVLRLDA